MADDYRKQTVLHNAQFISDYVHDDVPRMAQDHQIGYRDKAPIISFTPIELVEFLARFSVAYDNNRLNRLLKEVRNGEDSAVQTDNNGPQTD